MFESRVTQCCVEECRGETGAGQGEYPEGEVLTESPARQSASYPGAVYCLKIIILCSFEYSCPDVCGEGLLIWVLIFGFALLSLVMCHCCANPPSFPLQAHTLQPEICHSSISFGYNIFPYNAFLFIISK